MSARPGWKQLPASAAAVLLMAGPALGRPAAGEPPAVEVTMEVEGGAAYLKHDLKLKLSFRNTKEPAVTIGAEAFSPRAFTVVDEKGRPPRGAAPGASGASALHLDGYGAGERTVDLSAWYPRLSSEGKLWKISWAHGDHSVPVLEVPIIRPHDPDGDRFALVDTELGLMRWELLTESAPEHVRRFVDLSRQGFYDGLTIFRSIPALQAEGGDPAGDGTGAWARLMAAEIDPTLMPAAGMIGASRRESSMTSDSMFFITLGPSEFMQGKQTFFARVVDGWEVVARLQRVETSGATGFSDAFLLRQPIRIHSIRIK